MQTYDMEKEDVDLVKRGGYTFTVFTGREPCLWAEGELIKPLYTCGECGHEHELDYLLRVKSVENRAGWGYGNYWRVTMVKEAKDGA